MMEFIFKCLALIFAGVSLGVAAALVKLIWKDLTK
jgi:hypothetical protein